MRTLTRIRAGVLYPFRTRRRAALSVLALAAAGVLAWYGASGLLFRRSLAAAERSLAAYDFPAAREHLRECARLRPSDAPAHLLAAQAARRDGDLDAAEAQLRLYRKLAGMTADGRLEGGGGIRRPNSA